MFAKHLVVAVFLLGVAYAQTDESDLIKKVQDNIPVEFQGKVDPNQLEAVTNKTSEAFKAKCKKNGGDEAFTKAEKALKQVKTCLEALVDKDQLDREIEEAKPEGKIDEVFKKYCAKKALFKGCYKDALEAVKPCFSVAERANLNIVNNVTDQLAEFICYKDGDRIALFIAEGGRQCFEQSQEAIQDCVNGTLGPGINIDPANFSADSLPEINFGAKECGHLSKLQTCVVVNLEKCRQPTTANIAESLFKYIRKGTPCKDFMEQGESPRKANDPASQKSRPGSASGLAVTSLTLVMAAASLLV